MSSFLQPSLGDPLAFKGACFSYPTRPSVQVLRKLDLSVQKGQRVALVGQSGCGKSTCIQLLQRFYDLAQGEIVSSVPIKSILIRLSNTKVAILYTLVYSDMLNNVIN